MDEAQLPGEVVRRERRCRIHVCREVGKALCCADCRMRESCLDRCLNWPHRCGCAGLAGMDSRGNTITYKILD